MPPEHLVVGREEGEKGCELAQICCSVGEFGAAANGLKGAFQACTNADCFVKNGVSVTPALFWRLSRRLGGGTSPPACVITGIRGANTLPRLGARTRGAWRRLRGFTSDLRRHACLSLPCRSANCPRILNGPEGGVGLDFSRGDGGVVDAKWGRGRKKIDPPISFGIIRNRVAAV